MTRHSTAQDFIADAPDPVDLPDDRDEIIASLRAANDEMLTRIEGLEFVFEERRWQAALAAMQGLLASKEFANHRRADMVDHAVRIADDLVKAMEPK